MNNSYDFLCQNDNNNAHFNKVKLGEIQLIFK